MIRICKKHAQCYRCAKMDFGDKCDVPNGYGIDFLLDKPGTWYSTGSSRSIMCNVENEPCESALCEVRSELGMQTSDISLIYHVIIQRFLLKHESIWPPSLEIITTS